MLDVNENYFNRDFSLLEFNRRVLEQGLDAATPLLERVRFLAIFSSNLDEFFMKRAVRLKASPALAAACRERVQGMLSLKAEAWTRELLPALKEQGIEILAWDELSKAEKRKASEYFETEVYPLLTPMAVDPAHPFPFLSNLSVSLGIKLRRPDSDKPLFARIKIPQTLPQWLRLSEGPTRLLRLSDLVRHHLEAFFPEMIMEQVALFRVTRNADVGVQSEDVEDLVDVVAEELRMRRVAGIVRVQHESGTDPWMLDFVKGELELSDEDFFEAPGELNDVALYEVAHLERHDLKYPPLHQQAPHALKAKGSDFFKVLRGGDLLVHFPYESFESSVLRFVTDAVHDKNVLGIKITLYRIGDNSPLIPLLIRAAEAGKQVTCVVELKARFDEARNLSVSETLEKAGVHVVYGVVGLKTHSKICLVLRREAKGIRHYAHIGTGNYNPATSKSYTDLALFSGDASLCSDLVEVFNYLTGLSLKRDYKKFLLAPVNMRDRFKALIETETRNAQRGVAGRIVAKMNSFEVREFCDLLYEASKAGVKIDLIVRGICCLRPGVPGLSENIRVISVVGRFLEHSRIYYFRQGASSPAKGAFYIGSADWMTRNLTERVEAVVPVEDPKLRSRLWEILELYLEDSGQAWELKPDGSYVRLRQGSEVGVQDKLLRSGKS